jgi:recombinational DNA repair protein (RecF pathway)
LQLQQCLHCGANVDGAASFVSVLGGALCKVCATSAPAKGMRTYPLAVQQYMMATRDSADFTELRQLDRVAEATRLHARDLLVTMITHIAPRPLRSLEFIAKMSSALRRITPHHD